MRLLLPATSTLRDGVVIAFREIVDHGRDAARDADVTRAVHEYRKAVRRARALLAMCRPILRPEARRELARELRGAHRLSSPLRDLDAMLVVLRGFEEGPGADVVAHAMEKQRAAIDPGLVEAMLIEGAARIEPIPDRLVEEFPNEVTWGALARGARDTYRRARREMKDARTTGDERRVHGWRKRTKELNYQLELITSRRRSKKVRKLRKTYADMASELGAITDLLNLRNFARSRPSLLEDRDARALAKRADKRAGQLLRPAFRTGADAYFERPKQFGKLLSHLVEPSQNRSGTLR